VLDIEVILPSLLIAMQGRRLNRKLNQSGEARLILGIIAR